MLIFRKSGWTFDSSAGYGVGLQFLSASGGKIIMQDPKKQFHGFSYSGFGLAAGFPIPKIKLPPLPGVNRNISATGAPESFESAGIMYMTDSFSGSELTKSDIQGGTIYFDLSVGLLAAAGASAMLLGINISLLMPLLVNPGLFANLASNAIKSAPALLVMRGTAEGLIASVGGGATIGHLR